MLNNDKNLPEWKKVPIVPSDLDIDNVPKITISVAVACELNISFDCFVEVRKKHRKMSVKKEVCRQQLSLTFQQKKMA